jgi:hypothetical protein
MNVLLWISLIYAITRIDDYSSPHKHMYLAIPWIILGIPLVVFLYGLLTPYPSWLRRKREEISAEKPCKSVIVVFGKGLTNYSSIAIPYIASLNIANAVACFVLVVVYFYASALPQYNHARWEPGVDFSASLSLPSFAFIIPNGAFTLPTDTSKTFCYSLPSSGQSIKCPEAYSGKPVGLYLSGGKDPDFQAYIFDSTKLKQAPSTNGLSSNLVTGSQVEITLNVNCKTLFHNFKKLILLTLVHLQIQNSAMARIREMFHLYGWLYMTLDII